MLLSNEQRLQFCEVMVRIRHFEEQSMRLFSQGLTPGRMHPYMGQEAVAAGACAVLTPSDWIVTTHRAGGHLIARGADPRKLFAEYMGRDTGYCRGKGGPMHVGVAELRVLCTNAIVGSGIPVAVGAGLAIKMQGKKEIVLCFFGDGAANTGAFHEGLNLAAIWGLPVVFLCENNQYGETMPISKAIASESIACRGTAYGMPARKVDGNDVEAVYHAVEDAAGRARAVTGPSLIEAETYRYGGHFSGESQHYRSKEEVNAWREKDPIDRYRQVIISKSISGTSDLEAMEKGIEQGMEQAALQAMEDPFPPAESVHANVRMPLAWETPS